MTGVELDPLFLKAINLLRSKHPDSKKQLHDLVQEYREKTYGSSNLKKGNENNANGGKNNIDSIRQISNKQSPPTNSSTVKEKRTSPNISPNPVTLIGKLEEITNLITDEKSNDGQPDTEEGTIEEITVGSSLALEPTRKKTKLTGKQGLLEMSPLSDSEANDKIPIDDIIEMDFDVPMCKVCHLNKRSEDENLLVECSECHSYYHQNCHKPNVSTKDLNDPRLIWYCSRCTKKMNKEMVAQQQQSLSNANNNGKSNVETTTKIISNPFQQAKPFRRNITATDSSKVTNDTKVSTTSAISDTIIAGSREPPSQEGSPSSKQRTRDVAVNSMKRMELTKKKKGNKMQQLYKQSRK